MNADHVYGGRAETRIGRIEFLISGDIPKRTPSRCMAAQKGAAATFPDPGSGSAMDIGIKVFVRGVLMVVEAEV